MKQFSLLLSLPFLLSLLFPLSASSAIEVGPGGQVCFVCDKGYWRKLGGDGSCPEKLGSTPPVCKNEASETFEGCSGGDAKEGEICDKSFLESVIPQEPATSAGEDLFANPERMQLAVPAGEKVPDCKKFSGLIENPECRKFWPGIFLPSGTTETIESGPSASSDQPPSGTGGIEQIARDFLKKFLSLFIGKAGFLHSPNPASRPCASESEGLGGFQKCSQALVENLIPAEAGASSARLPYLVPPAGLANIADAAGNAQCVPPGLLLAITRKEASGSFNYTEEEITFFSSEKWWENASEEQKRKGYFHNTCDNPKAGCAPGDDVRGVMQFEKKTWEAQAQLAEVKRILVEKFGVPATYQPDRLNLRDAMIGTSVKIKRDSQTGKDQCTAWPESAVKKAASLYCGGGICQQSAACGVDFCGDVWSLYRSYSNNLYNENFRPNR